MSALATSKVPSRDVIPVPPVVIRMRASSAATCRSIQARTSAGSSRTIDLPVTTCPAASSRDTIAAPPVSVASVRVSLIVSTAQRTAAGAWARCSVWLMLAGSDPA